MDILPYEGRLTRKRYALFLVVCWVLTALAFAGALWAAMNLSNDFRAEFTLKYPDYAWPRLPWLAAAVMATACGLTLLVLPFSWMSYCIGRLHDLGCPAWTVLIVIVAALVVPDGLGAWFVNGMLVLIPGTAGANRYGADPRAADQPSVATPA